jgi:ubiquinone/menaquinone biosynthesis C-methylase UbiE
LSIKKAYDSWSKIYDTNLNKTRDLDAFATKETLKAFSYNRVLELGCGTGKNTLFLAQNAQEVVSLDFSEKMLAIARKKVTRSNVQFIQADINKEWGLSHNSFNLVVCNLVLEHINDLNSLFLKATRILEPKGKLFICELHPAKQYLGSKARYEDAKGIHELEVYTHHTSDYITTAYQAGFKFIQLKEWFDSDIKSQSIPRLISFVFEK